MSEREVRLPPRPMIPPALWVFVATWSCQKLVVRWGFRTAEDELMVVAAVAGLAWLVTTACILRECVRLHKAQAKVWVVTLAVAASGALCAALVGMRQARCISALQSRAMSSIELLSMPFFEVK